MTLNKILIFAVLVMVLISSVACSDSPSIYKIVGTYEAVDPIMEGRGYTIDIYIEFKNVESGTEIVVDWGDGAGSFSKDKVTDSIACVTNHYPVGGHGERFLKLVKKHRIRVRIETSKGTWESQGIPLAKIPMIQKQK
ncbi:MAG: hypothetical protein PVH61_24695 [Candidatus Aminicenantes bacterium]|jgi:hypothetical protein